MEANDIGKQVGRMNYVLAMFHRLRFLLEEKDHGPTPATNVDGGVVIVEDQYFCGLAVVLILQAG